MKEVFRRVFVVEGESEKDSVEVEERNEGRKGRDEIAMDSNIVYVCVVLQWLRRIKIDSRLDRNVEDEDGDDVSFYFKSIAFLFF